MLMSWSYFFVIVWCLGTSWDIFGSLEGPGVPNPGTKDMLIVAPWLHFGSLFWWKTCFFNVVFLNSLMDCFFIDFSWFWEPFWEPFWSIFDNFLKTEILWKIAPRLSESMMSKVLEGPETLLFCYCLVSGFWIGLGIVFYGFWLHVEVHFGSQNP